MVNIHQPMDDQARAEAILCEAYALIERAEALGVSLTISRVPLKPLAMGHATHEAQTWPARHQPAPKPAPENSVS